MGGAKESPRGRSDTPFTTRTPLESKPRALVVVAHPDDETLWVGGTMMMNPDYSWLVVSLCRGNDPDRRFRFFSAMTRLGSRGSIGDLDDGPHQHPLSDQSVREAVTCDLESTAYDLIATHSPFGEYTRHLRHEEVGRAVLDLWQAGELTAKEFRMFAYSDAGKRHYPKAIDAAHLVVSLPEDVWKKKLAIIQEVYGFAPDAWEAKSTPRKEAFWCFDRPGDALAWQRQYVSRTSHGAFPTEERKE